MNIGPYSIEDYMHMVKSFHGTIAPGIIIGGFMVDLAKRNLPGEVLYEVICETKTCLPDAVQLLTPCTIGNGGLRIMDFGRFALTLYDKYQGDGVRVFLDPVKLEGWPEIRDWFFKVRPAKEQDANRLRDQIIESGQDILTCQRVAVEEAYLVKMGAGAVGKCPSCKEAYPLKDGPSCLACQGASPYRREEAREVKPGLKVVITE